MLNPSMSKIFASVEGRYVYGGELPRPKIPGNLTAININYILKKESGSVVKGTKFYKVELIVKREFLVERPMG